MEILPSMLSYIFCLISVSYISFGGYLVFINSREESNRIFLVLCVCLSIWAFGFAMAISALNLDTCFFWRRVAALGGSAFVSILLHLFLKLTDQKRLLKKWWIYFLLYVPAAAFIYVFSLSHDLALIQYNLILTPFGWINIAANNVWDKLYYLYYYGFILIGLGLTWHWGKHTKEERNKKQANLILLGFVFSFVVSSIGTIISSKLLGTNILQIAPNTLFISILGIFYSIKKYQLVKMTTINVDEVILNEETRRKIFNYLSFSFMVGSVLNVISQYLLEEQHGDLIFIIQFSGLLLGIGLAIQIIQRIKKFENYKDTIILMLIVVAIPIITFGFISEASLTIWAFPFILIIIALVFNNRIALVGITVSIFLTQILVFITKAQVIVKIDSDDHVVRIGLFGIAIWVAFFVNKLYVQRLKENAEQIKIQKLISQVSTDFVTVSSTNFDEKIKKWIDKSGELFSLDRACAFMFSKENGTLSCTKEWCKAGVVSKKEFHQNMPLETAPDWMCKIINKESVCISDKQEKTASRNEHFDKLHPAFISIPIACKGEVLGFLAFETYTDKAELSDKYKVMIEIIANVLADAMLKIDSEKEINYRAYYDQLTEIPNRLLFNDRLSREIELSNRTGKMIGIIFLNLDFFKTANDIMGHEGGDKLLVQVAKKLVQSIKEIDTVSRFGGDEFLIMLRNITKEQEIIKIANRIIRRFKHAFIINDQEFFITASFGIAVYPTDGETGEVLINNAHIAMYKAKEKGKNQYVVCSETIKEEVHLKMILTNSLYHAQERHELIIYYQPQVCLKTEKIVAVEALLRWQHPELGMISPTVMIPLAEQTGLINPIGEWVLKTACWQNKTWQDMGLPHVRMAVNISATQFRNPILISQVKNILVETGLKPKHLELELTENIAINKSNHIVSALNGLKKLGVFISIDDFGTEYSSLSRLKMLPIDQIKMDKQFVDGITGSEKDQAIANTIILLGKNLGLNVIAEGVETEAQIKFLKENLCDTVQGFYYYRPMPAEEIEKVLRQE